MICWPIVTLGKYYLYLVMFHLVWMDWIGVGAFIYSDLFTVHYGQIAMRDG